MGSSDSPLRFERVFHYFARAVWPSQTDAELFAGRYWFHTYDRVLWSDDLVNPKTAMVRRPDGMTEGFKLIGSAFVTTSDSQSLLTVQRDGVVITGFRLERAGDEVELYDPSGRLIKITDRSERSQTLSYSNGRLATVTDQKGRQLTFSYNTDGRIETMGTPDGNYAYTWVGENVTSLTYPGETSKLYHYEDTAQPNALTGITDEAGVRYTTYTYRSDGFVSQTTRAGGVDTVNYNFTQNGRKVSAVAVTNPLGFVQTYNMGIAGDKTKLTGVSAPCSGCGGTASAMTYDSNGNLKTQTDFRGTVTGFDYNARSLEFRRIDAKTITGGSSPAEKRITETDWHASFRVPTQVRVCAANTANVCPASATVASHNLVSKVSMTYNTRGQLLTRTMIDPSNASRTRTSTNTYCDAIDSTACPLVGLLRTANGPRTDVSDVTTYSYRMADATDGSGYKKGDVWLITNALGQVVEYQGYDAAGRPTRVLDAAGVQSEMTYHPRGWLQTRTTRSGAADATATFTYEPYGEIKRITQADGSYTEFVRDPAHRITAVFDNLNNRINYVLDNAGNRTVERTLDPNGVLKRRLAREFDTLSRLQKERDALTTAAATSAPNTDGRITASYSYDPNGNLSESLDGLQQAGQTHAGRSTDFSYDPLNRMATTLDAQALDTDNANRGKIIYGYDARNNLVRVTDPKNLATIYTYDGLNDLTQLNSPDTGITGYTFDSAGNRATQTDARGVQTLFGYDALNRLTSISYPSDASANSSFVYDTLQSACSATDANEKFSVGKLTGFTDKSGSTALCYDWRGNGTVKAQTTGSVTYTLRMAYNAANRLTQLTYPSGTVVAYGRDAVGRINAVSVNGSPVVAGVSYAPFGPPELLSFGDGSTLARGVDTNYRTSQIVSSLSDGLKLYFEFDVLGNITRADNDALPNSTSPEQRAYSYDHVYRLTDIKSANAALIERFAYDKTGNRTEKQQTTQPSETYTYAASNHRLTSAGGGTRTYDATGSTTFIPIGNGPTGQSFAYDARGRMASSGTTSSYNYNARGERVWKAFTPAQSPVEQTSFVYDESGHLLAELRTQRHR